jgi:hypothetical protein
MPSLLLKMFALGACTLRAAESCQLNDRLLVAYGPVGASNTLLGANRTGLLEVTVNCTFRCYHSVALLAMLVTDLVGNSSQVFLIMFG